MFLFFFLDINRIATKSIRVPELIKRALKLGGSQHFKGLMCFSVEEAFYLSEKFDLDDFLIAYPTVQGKFSNCTLFYSIFFLSIFFKLSHTFLDFDLKLAFQLIVEKERKITLMVDSVEQLKLISSFWKREQQSTTNNNAKKCRVAIDLDASFRLFDGKIHLGAHRSPVHDLKEFSTLVTEINTNFNKEIEFVGLMCYEAHIAGLTDQNPFGSAFVNSLKLWFKVFATKQLKERRENVFNWLRSNNISFEIYNGGGTGSLSETCEEKYLTEITMGSGLLQSSLFDYYENSILECAFVFALQVTRKPGEGMICCQSGGFIASGEINKDKAPVPFLPQNLEPFESEGFGEGEKELK